MIPGEVITPETDIELNVGRETLKVVVANLGD
ncbi:urease subunit beta, partial [Acinetobacter baumannii]